jgi:hypothetical protein
VREILTAADARGPKLEGGKVEALEAIVAGGSAA